MLSKFFRDFFNSFRRENWNYHRANVLRTRFIIVLGVIALGRWFYLHGAEIPGYLSHLVGR